MKSGGRSPLNREKDFIDFYNNNNNSVSMSSKNNSNNIKSLERIH